MVRPKVSLEQAYHNTKFLDGNSGTHELLTNVIDELHTRAVNKKNTSHSSLADNKNL